ncbi:hypothetical protein E2C01_021350 [Portunus trituberculatus]|uniref:Uncharacterized protein n=1 Tax=Portunus trituberculatus TaxID=210409 RepID=A0A5B7E4Q4_PORTR|nr:hypothetical protein [Portunus trituberculatus]
MTICLLVKEASTAACSAPLAPAAAVLRAFRPRPPITSPTGVPPEPAEWMLEVRWRRLVGGMSSAGKTVGSLFPALADSQRYIASTNSSHDSRPSLSTSESALSVVVYKTYRQGVQQGQPQQEPLQYQELEMNQQNYHKESIAHPQSHYTELSVRQL